MARLIDPQYLERIKKAVVDLVIEEGFEGVSVAMISKMSGVSPGYLYRHYENRDDLLYNVVEENQKVYLEELVGLMNCSKNKEDFIKAFIDKCLEWEKKDRKSLLFIIRIYTEKKLKNTKMVNPYIIRKRCILLEKKIFSSQKKDYLLDPKEAISQMQSLVFTSILDRYMRKEVLNDKEKESMKLYKLCIGTINLQK